MPMTAPSPPNEPLSLAADLGIEKFALVLVDVNMPNMDGLSLVRALRGMADYRYTPLLMLTTESSPEKKAAGRAAGATGWVVKPFDPDQLVATVRRVLG